MNRSHVQLLDLPDEILMYILKKLSKIDVLYSLLGTGNDRLNCLAQDKQFSNTLELIFMDDMLLNRFCNDILRYIHRNVQQLTVESSTMERILLAGHYPNLSHLKLDKFGQDPSLQSLCLAHSTIARIFQQQITDLILTFDEKLTFASALKDYTINVYANILTLCEHLQHLTIDGSSITAYPGLSLTDLPDTTFSSSILTKLSIHVSKFDDCLYLLDGRLTRLINFSVRVYDIGAPSSIVHNTKNVCTLKSFSLTCHSHINTYDNRVLPLIRRLCNLEELTLCLTVRDRNNLIDGIHLRNEILNHLVFLQRFIFDIRSWSTTNNNLIEPLSNDDIQQTFTNIGYRNVGCSIRHCHENHLLCHVFSLPFTFDYLQCITNNFPSVIFNHVLYLSVCDILPFEHEFFLRLARSFPLLKHVTVSNTLPQMLTSQEIVSTIVTYPHLTYLSVMCSDLTYAEQFLLETRTHLPCLIQLRIESTKLTMVTENFTRDSTRRNCAGVKELITETMLTHSTEFSLYFPLL